MRNRSKYSFLVFLCLSRVAFAQNIPANESNMSPVERHHFKFQDLADTWDEAIPLGNGLLGALIWRKEGKLRISIDRSDLWDKRPLDYYSNPSFRYDSIADYAQKGDMKSISEIIKYNKAPGPTKIPAGAMEFDITDWGNVSSVYLDIKTAISTVRWANGVELECFVHAIEPIGWYRFTNLPDKMVPKIVPPDYAGERTKDNPSWWLVKNLEYEDPVIQQQKNKIIYNQKCWNDFGFEVHTQWQFAKNTLEGKWTIRTTESKEKDKMAISAFQRDKKSHTQWWSDYWSKSQVSVPDTIIEKQYYCDMYKFGAVARRGAPAISLQAVWTADNDSIAPWFGDFHNDLNTQLSYWPAYAGNHLNQSLGFAEWNWNNRTEYKKFTKSYFRAKGMNMPGIMTIEGKPMGSWVQYSLSVTAAGWIGKHFYHQWKYSLDEDFLKNKGYPWIKDVALFFEDISVVTDGKRNITLSASPEIYDNTKEAWFDEITNFDLSIIRFTYKAAAEMAQALGHFEEAAHWRKQLQQWPSLASNETDGLLLAVDHPLKQSHRHHSHLLAIHPLGLIDVNNGEKDQKTISASLDRLEQLGTKNWVGYSFSWLASLRARALDGNAAAEALRTFATAFCLKNSFHVNGDQTKSGYSRFTYRPFTLEGNFAFASAVHEMLIQSHAGHINLFPAIPNKWQNVSFKNLRTEGAFLVSADMDKGKLKTVQIKAEKEGHLKIKNSFKTDLLKINNKQMNVGDFIEIDTRSNEIITIESLN